jgi:hypothetical protein
MVLQPLGAMVRVDVEGKLFQAGDRRVYQLAAGGNNKLVVRHRDRILEHVDRNERLRCVDAGSFAFDQPDSDRLEYLRQGDQRWLEIRFIVPYTDAVVLVRIDQDDFNAAGGRAGFREFSSGPHGAPKAGKATA